MGPLTLTQAKEVLETAPSLLLLDVRTEEEHNAKRIEGSTNIPLSELPHRLSELTGNETILIYCNEGVRAQNAYRFLRSNSTAELFYIAGSSTQWDKAGLPVVATPCL